MEQVFLIIEIVLSTQKLIRLFCVFCKIYFKMSIINGGKEEEYLWVRIKIIKQVSYGKQNITRSFKIVIKYLYNIYQEY